ncbi:Polyribonucleotide nucleotidyltransferase [Bienertia sinuspersici]
MSSQLQYGKMRMDHNVHDIKLFTSQNTRNYELNSTSGTKVHINLDITEVHTFRESITSGHPNKIEMIKVQQPDSIEETMKKTGKTIKELQELYNIVEENQINRKTINHHEKSHYLMLTT